MNIIGLLLHVYGSKNLLGRQMKMWTTTVQYIIVHSIYPFSSFIQSNYIGALPMLHSIQAEEVTSLV